MISSDKFIELGRKAVVDYYNDRVESKDKNGTINLSETFVVWYAKILKNHKGLFSTTVPDGMYYELTYNGDTNEIYLDAYKKWQNVVVNVDSD